MVACGGDQVIHSHLNAHTRYAFIPVRLADVIVFILTIGNHVFHGSLIQVCRKTSQNHRVGCVDIDLAVTINGQEKRNPGLFALSVKEFPGHPSNEKKLFQRLQRRISTQIRSFQRLIIGAFSPKFRDLLVLVHPIFDGIHQVIHLFGLEGEGLKG